VVSLDMLCLGAGVLVEAFADDVCGIGAHDAQAHKEEN
jgi:hypothetical protein